MLYSNTMQLTTPIDAVTFDCDGTLSAIEGIDDLAQMNGVGDAVTQLTADAMTNTGLNPALYQQRLKLVQPTQTQVLDLGKRYFLYKTEDTFEVIQLLKSLKKEIFILSAGLYPAVELFGKLLRICENNIFAVNINFDEQGNFSDFDRESLLVHNQGKRIIGAKLKETYSRIIHVGDGLNDYSIHDVAVRFIGYGGVFYRENMAKLAHHYIACQSMAAILPFCLTLQEVNQLSITQYALYNKGLKLLPASSSI